MGNIAAGTLAQKCGLPISRFVGEIKKIDKLYLPLTSKKAGRSDRLLGFARSLYIVTRDSASLLCATTPHPSYFSKS